MRDLKPSQSASRQVTFNWSCSNCKSRFSVLNRVHPVLGVPRMLSARRRFGGRRRVPARFSVNAQNASCVTPDWIIKATYSPSALPEERCLKSTSQKWKEATFFWILSRNATDTKIETTFCSRRMMQAPQWPLVVGSRAVLRLLAGSKQKQIFLFIRFVLIYFLWIWELK